MTDHMAELFDAVQKRPRPEDVAELVLEAFGDAKVSLPKDQSKLLNEAAKHSIKRQGNHWYSSMASDFDRPISAEKQVKTAATVFGVEPLKAAECWQPDKVEDFIGKVSAQIQSHYGDKTKMTKIQRRQAGIYKNARWYNRRWRMLRHLEDKLRRLAFNNRRYLFTRISKSALAVQIPFDEFKQDLNTACLVAYMSARMSMRSTFTNTSQTRAFDKVAEALLQRCETHSQQTRWDLIAHLMPDQRIVQHLTDQKKGELLGKWWTLMDDMADMLREVYQRSQFDLATMTVSRGNDSSTWNQVAGAWNQARTHWLSMVHEMGYDGALDHVLPGKVMRLMAADVMAWHQSTGDTVHPDTRVWAELPPPWEVLKGTADCNRQIIEAVCQKHGVKSESWTSQRQDRKAVKFEPTPELVHGVTVASPALATILRKAGVFSGKGLKYGFETMEGVEKNSAHIVIAK